MSDINAEGFDFVVFDGKEKRPLCVKTTEGDFSEPIHISLNELHEMRKSNSYELYRIYEMTGTKANLAIAHNLQSFAKQTLDVLEQLPEGVYADGITVSPEIFEFDPPIPLESPKHE